MRNLLLTLILSLSTLATFSQVPDTLPWCPPGATWTYIQNSMVFNYFTRYTYVGDTVIQGNVAKKLKVGQVVYLGGVGSAEEYRSESPNLGFEYLYNSNDSVYYWYDGAFNFMYSFNAQVNDTFQISNSREVCPYDSVYPAFAKVGVTDVWKDTLNGVIYDKFWTSDDQPYEIGGVIRNIGSTLCLLPQANSAVCRDTTVIDGWQEIYLGLSCYFDSLRGEISFGYYFSGGECYGIRTSSETLVDPAPEVRIFPNPVSDHLEVTGLSVAQVEYMIYDIQGRSVQSGVLKGNVIQVGELPAGVFAVRFFTSSGQVSTVKFVKVAG